MGGFKVCLAELYIDASKLFFAYLRSNRANFASVMTSIDRWPMRAQGDNSRYAVTNHQSGLWFTKSFWNFLQRSSFAAFAVVRLQSVR